jgi:hypothetical protein
MRVRHLMPEPGRICRLDCDTGTELDVVLPAAAWGRMLGFRVGLWPWSSYQRI